MQFDQFLEAVEGVGSYPVNLIELQMQHSQADQFGERERRQTGQSIAFQSQFDQQWQSLEHRIVDRGQMIVRQVQELKEKRERKKS